MGVRSGPRRATPRCCASCWPRPRPGAVTTLGNTTASILRDYREAGSVNGLLALWGFVDDTTFLTKAGHVGVVYRVRGVDYEGLSHGQRQTLAHRFEAAL